MLLHDDADRLRAGILGHDPEAGTVPLGPDGEPWAPPAPLTTTRDLPSFPVDVFPPWLAEVVDGYATQFQVPADLPGMLALPILATAAPRIAVEVKPGWTEPHLGLYVVVALESGDRKTPVFSAMTRPLVEWEAERARALRPVIARARATADLAGRRLEHETRKAARKPEASEELEDLAVERDRLEAVVPVVPQLFTADCTPERLSSLMAEQDGRLSLLSDEAGLFEILGGRYSSHGAANLDAILQGYSGSPIRVDRQGRRSDRIDAPMVSIGLAVQPSVVRGLGDVDRFRGRGLLGRFAWCCPDSLLGRRDQDSAALAPTAAKDYARRLVRLLELRQEQAAGERELLRLSPDGRRILLDFQADLEPRLTPVTGDLHWLADWCNKLAGSLARVAGLLHLARAGSAQPDCEIPAETVGAALRLGPYLTDHARFALGAMGQDPAIASAERLLPYLARLRAERFSVREVHQLARGSSEFKKADSVKAALSLLAQLDYVRPVDGPERKRSGRRPSQVYAVNPLWPSQNPHNSRVAGL